LADLPIRLFFDENLSPRLVLALADLYPGSTHVDAAGLLETPDQAIWEYAAEHDLIIVSKDEDFVRLSVLLGPPPKVVAIRLGNCTTEDVIRVLVENRDAIRGLVNSEEQGLLELA
jgi:predicted nuclease of predicted toxin-antitoxin system